MPEFFTLQAFDALIHFIFEGSFLYLSTFGREVNTSVGPFAEMCTCLPFVNAQSIENHYRERICSRRLPLGLLGPNSRLS